MELQTIAPRRGRPPLHRPEDSVETTTRLERVPLEISRLTLQDWSEWGGWLLQRFNFYWPGYTETRLRGVISSLTASNDQLLIKNDDSILMAQTFVDPLTGKPYVQERFGWSRHAKPLSDRRMGVDSRSEGSRNLIDLYRFCRNWGRSKGALFHLGGFSCDAPLSDLRNELNAEWVDWVIFR
jgi:hypothetical protein